MMFGEHPLLSKVTLHDMADAPSKYVSDQGKSKHPIWGAWTNSSTDVYIHNVIYNPEEVEAEFGLDLTLMHESYHVIQFELAGAPPATFEAMLQYEWKAYGLTSVSARLWALAKPDVEDAAVRAQWVESTDGMAETVSAVLDRIALETDAAKREAECMNFLILKGAMPLAAQKLTSPQPLYEPS